jgi:ABC-type branched-subunit amino acid transport system substrate-binding protein
MVRAADNTPIRVGEINSHSAVPAFTLPYRKGWQMAMDEINAAGRMLGRELDVISRDDAGKPADAIRLAGELVDDQTCWPAGSCRTSASHCRIMRTMRASSISPASRWPTR